LRFGDLGDVVREFEFARGQDSRATTRL
jgi:hypothetical protein